MTDKSRPPVLSDTIHPPKAPQTERWLSDWATQSDNCPATHTKMPAEQPAETNDDAD